jgi:hypothetical protein
MAADYAHKDLGLDLIRVRFFELGPLFSGTLATPEVDKALVVLNAGSFDPGLMGKAVDPRITLLPTVWVRARLSPVATAAIVLHEARHVRQMTIATTTAMIRAEEERKVEKYLGAALLHLGFVREDIARAMEACGFTAATRQKEKES